MEQDEELEEEDEDDEELEEEDEDDEELEDDENEVAPKRGPRGGKAGRYMGLPKKSTSLFFCRLLTTRAN